MATVLITGIGKGIGAALGERFLAEGYDVIGTYPHGTPPPERERLRVFPLDLADAASIMACADAVAATGMLLDVFVNNAGVLLDAGRPSVDLTLLRTTLEINVIGTIHFTELLLSRVRDGGHIVNVTSRAGSLASVAERASHSPGDYPCYRISKAAMNMYTVTLAERLRTRAITVSAVHPGWARTDIGGSDADLSAGEAAENVYSVAVARPETGGFWYRDERFPW